MKPRVAAMTVDKNGRVVLANQAARDRFPGCVGRRCADVVRFRDANGDAVCNPTCWQSLAAEEGARDVEGQAIGSAARLVCVGLLGADGSTSGTVMVVPARPPVLQSKIALSMREREVVELMVRGKSGPQIAKVLGIRASTVRTHVDHVKEKLGVRKNTELVSKILALGILER